MSELTNYQNNPLSTMPHTEVQKLLAQALSLPIKSNPYTAQITRANPSALLFLVDQSGSMVNKTLYKGENMSKAKAVAMIINELFDSFIARCTRSEGIRDYFEIALIGYGGKSAIEANILWGNMLANREFVKISELAANFIEEIEIEEEQVIRGQPRKTNRKIKTWLKPVSNFQTPMNSALGLATSLLERWIISHNSGDSFPPIVFNITDGAATDAENDKLLTSTERIKQLHTTDGNVLFINIHISSDSNNPVIFPANFNELPTDTYAELLYNMSSEMPINFHKDIANFKGCDLQSCFVGMAFNADTTSLVQMLNIGTSTCMNQTQK